MRVENKLIFALIFLISEAVLALPTRDSFVPQAEVAKPGVWRFEIETQRTWVKNSGDTGGEMHKSSVGFTSGIQQYGVIGVEAGLDWVEPTNDGIPESFMGHLRLATMTLEEHGWGAALGIHSVGFKSEQNDYNVIYGVVQNTIGKRWLTAVGGYAGSSKLLINELGAEDSKGAFLGVWWKVQGDKRGRVGLEWQSGRNLYGGTYLGITGELDQGLYGHISLVVPNNQAQYRNYALFRMVIDF